MRVFFTHYDDPPLVIQAGIVYRLIVRDSGMIELSRFDPEDRHLIVVAEGPSYVGYVPQPNIIGRESDPVLFTADSIGFKTPQDYTINEIQPRYIRRRLNDK